MGNKFSWTKEEYVVEPPVYASKAIPESFDDSCWVGFYLNTHDAELLMDDRLDMEDRLHLTLAITRPLTDYEVHTLKQELDAIVKKYPPIRGMTTGAGIFELDEEDCLHATFDAPLLSDLRSEVAIALDRVLQEDHEYTPHITLAYVDKGFDADDIGVLEVEMTFPMLTLAVGEVNYHFALGYGYAGEQDWGEGKVIPAAEIPHLAAGAPTQNQDRDFSGWDDEVKAVPFFDVVGQKARTKDATGVIEQIKRFGEHEGITATKENPVVWIAGKAFASSDVELLLSV